MRLVIDLQGAQSTGSRNRGIGRYSLSLAQGLVRNRGDDEVVIALNGLFPETIEPIQAAFDRLLPKDNIRVWSTPSPVYAADDANNSRRQAAELIREQFLASLSPDMVLITSLFEGLGDNALTSIGSLSEKLNTAVILYDLIPLIHRGVYLQNTTVEQWYENKLDHLRRADLLLSISASSGKEGVDYLGFNPQQVKNILTAADAHFTSGAITSKERSQLASRYGLKKPFVMYTGGIDYRKNIEGLITAYAQLPDVMRSDHQLAVVCSIQQAERERLNNLARDEGLKDGELILTGFVPEQDLLACYRACKLFVFPSWHEGFGLPALEAMHCGRAVIAANTASLPEVVGREDALFDPFNTDAIAQKMAHVLGDDALRAELEKHGPIQAKKFSWDKTAKRAWSAIRSSAKDSSNASFAPDRRPRLAYVSPLQPAASGIADYSAELLPELSRHYRIDVIAAQDEVTDPFVRANCQIRDAAWFRRHAREFDRVLYHFGNSHFHSHMFELLYDQPGVVVLHDFFLSGVINFRDVHREDPHAFSKALLRSHGWTAVRERFEAADTSETVWKYPANLEVLQQSLGVIVHADYSRQLAQQWYGPSAAADWCLIQHMRKPAHKVDRMSARQALGIPEDGFVVCSFGHLGPTKLNHRLVSAWQASSLARDPRCQLVFVGQNEGGNYGAELIRSIDTTACLGEIRITGWAETATFRQWLSVADVGVQLRATSRGETSGTVLDCMNYGLAIIVNANGSMAELPRGSLWMLPDEFDDNELAAALETLYSDKTMRDKLGSQARKVILERHGPRKCGDQYAIAIEEFYTRAKRGARDVLTQISSLAPRLTELDQIAVARSIAFNSRPQLHRRQWLVDCTLLLDQIEGPGEESIAIAFLRHLMLHSPTGVNLELVRFDPEKKNYVTARAFGCGLLGIADEWIDDETIEAWQGDSIVLMTNSSPEAKQAIEQNKLMGLNIVSIEAPLRRIRTPCNIQFDRLISMIETE